MKKLELLTPANYMEMLKNRREELKTALQTLKKETGAGESGEIHISVRKYGPQYYYRKTKRDKNGKYISKKQMEFIKKVAQQSYNKLCIRKISAEIKLIDQFLLKIGKNKICTTENGESFRVERRNLLETATLNHQKYAEKWQKITYKSKEMWKESAVFQTIRGEQVRSKSEVLIADTLHRLGVPYRYEYPLKLQHYTAYPDFYCLNLRTRKEFYWEHLGLMDEQSYVERAMEKLKDYENQNYFPGSNLIVTMETKDWTLTPQRIEKIIATYLS